MALRLLAKSSIEKEITLSESMKSVVEESDEELVNDEMENSSVSLKVESLGECNEGGHERKEVTNSRLKNDAKSKSNFQDSASMCDSPSLIMHATYPKER
ncbi:hypothetical protein TNIN_95731 [Trichonephila inaurata madagascariensis]|uniref:Uncharacterized protein n=1 Tax=Trichonephila inaurata madagascariensis TaxID=2747483 RepID=A0A8X6X5R5_9ARAC|nr:hypothetical protein TNIN_95731 [Trichonephila inaurata madagascariensis]